MLNAIKKFSLLLLVALSITACATVEGIGEDVETAGEEIQEASH